jgi:hypothetical protein
LWAIVCLPKPPDLSLLTVEPPARPQLSITGALPGERHGWNLPKFSSSIVRAAIGRVSLAATFPQEEEKFTKLLNVSSHVLQSMQHP